MSHLFSNRGSMNMIHYLLHAFLFIKLSLNSPSVVHEINEAVFINPHTNIALIPCPLIFKQNSQIQWYDVIQRRYEVDYGGYYRIYGLQPYDRELICSSVSKNELESTERYKIRIRTYDRPLPVPHISISKKNSTSLTVLWNDDIYNRNANITHYDLVLRYHQTILENVLVDSLQYTYTFSSLEPDTLYSIDISVIDMWQRPSQSITITGQTLSDSNRNISFHKIIDSHLLDQSTGCYHLNHQLLLVEFNRSRFLMLNYIYNLTIFNEKDNVILTDQLYSFEQSLPIMKTSNSFIYDLKEKYSRYKMKLSVSTIQLEYLGLVYKFCEEFYPVYSPLTCSVEPLEKDKYQLIINTQLFNDHKRIITLKPNDVFYQTNKSNYMKQNIHEIDKYTTVDIYHPKDNYSIILENNLISYDKYEKLNISILCSTHRLASNQQNSEISNSAIVTIILIILTIILLSIIILVIAIQKKWIPNRHSSFFPRMTSPRKHRRPSFLQINSSTHDNLGVNCEDYDPASIPLDIFPAYVKYLHRNNDFGFIQLFENICDLSKTYKFSCDVAQHEYNQSKNRYINILTYDHSRVKLSSNNDDDNNESYINANFVDGIDKMNTYIATQAPMSNTVNDFWKMIWEKDVTVLVMITNIKECGRIKCDLYWPAQGTQTYGTVQVTLISTISLAYYIKRIFSIRCETNGKQDNIERLVYQFHFTNWPDHGVPLFTLPALSFIRNSSACSTATSGPIVVHCSAGVGRTGTYIVIDTMLKKINRRQPLDIPVFLKHIRQQRNFLVQTEEQFIFIYDVLNEAVQVLNIGYDNLELNVFNIESIFKTLDTYKNNSSLTQIDKQFRLITGQIKFNHRLLSIGQTMENISKNRTQTVLPLNPCRVVLSTTSTQPSADYINASYFHGYYRATEFIVTQHPMAHTKFDFWQMVWDARTNIIVSLYADEKLKADVPDFWPAVNQAIDFGSFLVYLTDERFEYEFICREFSLRSIEEDSELQVKLISSTYWPETCSPIKTSFNLINKIRNYKSVRPILVHDYLGGHRAATFCALYTMSEQIEMEGTLNVYELAKFYYFKRPGIWRHHNDLLFLYECAKVLFDEYKISDVNSHHSSPIPL